MGGACRESYRMSAILRYQRGRVFTRRFWRYFNWRLFAADNFAWMACAIIGHRPYNTSTVSEPAEHACSRCYQWLKALDPTEWYCGRHDVTYPLPGACETCRVEWQSAVIRPLQGGPVDVARKSL
jgi:hypothetical protein